ncbi:hypothetical protein, partial [Noviherbaspirillum sp.]|uniref:hypothetical protein n=1 Tax=Noviherbaspirillum sp. TaxID=1926288 RepID=UPI002D36D836
EAVTGLGKGLFQIERHRECQVAGNAPASCMTGTASMRKYGEIINQAPPRPLGLYLPPRGATLSE